MFEFSDFDDLWQMQILLSKENVRKNIFAKGRRRKREFSYQISFFLQNFLQGLYNFLFYYYIPRKLPYNTQYQGHSLLSGIYDSVLRKRRLVSLKFSIQISRKSGHAVMSPKIQEANYKKKL